MNERSLLLCLAGLAALAPTVEAQTVTLLPGTTARGLSRDGLSVTGWSGGQPFLWQKGTGFTALTGSVYNTRGVSDAGAVVVGMVDDPVSGMQSSGYWAAATGTWVALGNYPGFGGCPGYGEARAVSADGSKLGGELFLGCNLKPYTWTQSGGYTVLPMTGGFGDVSALSGDGQVAGGWDTHPSLGFRRAALWDAALNETFPLVSPANVHGAGEISLLNHDGSIYAGADEGLGAFVYRNGTLTVLGVPNNFPRPKGLSEDGGVVVGSWGSPGVGFNPWVWTDCGGPQRGDDFFAERGVHFPAGLTLVAMLGVSRDGSTFLASYTIPGGPSGAVYIELLADWQPAVYCQAKVNSQGCTPSICATGLASLSLPVAFDITLHQALNNEPGLFFYGVGGAANIPFGGGTLCVAPPIRRTDVQVSGGNPPPDDCSGTYRFDFNAFAQSGGDLSLTAGVTIHGQYWARDPNHPDGTGVSLSDAVTFVLHP